MLVFVKVNDFTHANMRYYAKYSGFFSFSYFVLLNFDELMNVLMNGCFDELITVVTGRKENTQIVRHTTLPLARRRSLIRNLWFILETEI